MKSRPKNIRVQNVEQSSEPVKKKDNRGRKPYTIDWQLVDRLIAGGCNGEQVAAQIGMHPDTLYHRVKEEFNILFTDYSAQKRQKGNALIHAAQFEKAVKSKDSTMLIWLGKQRLDQREPRDNTLVAPNEQQVEAALDHIKDKAEILRLQKQVLDLTEQLMKSRSASLHPNDFVITN